MLKFIGRVLETIAVYFIISAVIVILLASKMKNHFPPTKADLNEFFTKMNSTIAKSEETINSLQKIAEMSASVEPQMQKYFDSEVDSKKRIELLENRVKSLEEDLRKVHQHNSLHSK